MNNTGLLNKSDDKSKNIRPCFPSCRVEKIKDFSINAEQFKHNFELMLNKLKQYKTDGTTATVKNKKTNAQMEGDIGMDFAKIIKSLSAQTYKNSDGQEVCKYRLLNVTDSKVFALDMDDYKPYSFNYAAIKVENDETVIIDFESKTEMSLSATDKIKAENFEEFSIKNEIDTVKEIYSQKNVEAKIKEVTEKVSATFQKDYDELKEAYDNLVKAHNIVQSKVDAYEKKEKEAETERHKNEINALIDSYAGQLSKYSAYLVYKANIEQKYEMTKEQVEQDLIIMAGKYLTSRENSANKKFSYTPIETRVINNTNDPIHNRYGHLLDKYIK